MEIERFDFEYLSEEGLIKSVHPSGEYMRFAQHAAAMAEKDAEIQQLKETIAANAPILAQATKSVEDAQGTVEELGATVERMREALEEIIAVSSGMLQVAQDDTEGMAWIEKRAQVALTDPAPKQSTEGEQP